MKSRTKDVGIYRPRHTWRFTGDVRFKKTGRMMGRVLDAPGSTAFVRDARGAGQRIVFTNGVFDILHPGHVRYLQAARAHGDLLIVGLNSDASVRRNKGPERPINPEHERAEVLAALACVDAVSIFDDDTPADIIRRVQPDILVKGADWPAIRSWDGIPSRRAAAGSSWNRSSRGTRRARSSTQGRPGSSAH